MRQPLLTIFLSLSMASVLDPFALGMGTRTAFYAPSVSQESAGFIAQAACDSAIAWVSRDIARLRVNIAAINIRSVFDPEEPWGYPDNPFPNRNRQIIFVLDQLQDGGQAEALMNSPQLQLAYARRVIAGCEDVSIVAFGLDASDYIIRLFLLPDETVQHGIPVPAGEGVQNVPWGHYIFIHFRSKPVFWADGLRGLGAIGEVVGRQATLSIHQ